MAVPFLYLVLSFIFFLPNICCSCRRSLCGNITIEYPFSLNHTTSPNSPPPSNGLPMVPLQHPNSPPPSNGLPMVPLQHVDDCDGFLTINCNQGQATITIGRHEFVVMDIAHSNKVITVQDITLSHEHFRRPCAFFLNFTHPIYDYDLFISHQVEGFRNCPQDCELGFGISQTLSAEPFSLTECGDYSLYYWNELNQHDVNESCKTEQPAFEWKLSYNELNGSFSLLSVGFSQHFQLREDCFNCHVDGKSCTSNKGAVNSSCWCETTCESKDQLPFKKRDGWHSKRTMAIVVGFAGFVLVSLSLVLCLYKHKKIRSSILCEKHLNDNQSIEDFLADYGSVAPKRYTYSQLKKITKAFKEELGQGGYGTVFKGTLIDGHIVAVKMLKESKGNGEEFMNEVASIGRTSHVNIVSLLGFCFEGQKRALVYDFMCNGSLEKLLNTDKPKTILHWEKLHQIAIGIARGLEYLHRGCNTRIVHFDIKPHNILLDQDFCPKISDFGLAKLCLVKDSIISLAGARGTIGYIAPEVFSRNFGVVSSKSDVYSYGMMVLEMAEGKKNPNHSVKNSSEMYFPHWIYEHLQQNQDLLLCGVNTKGEETVRKMILVGLWCIQTLPQNRPSMSRVIEMLEGSVNDLQLPPKPYLSSSPFGSVVDASLIQEVSLTDDYSSEIS